MTIQPDMPPCSVREEAEVCRPCRRAIDDAADDACACAWCGDPAFWDVYPIIRFEKSYDKLGYLCTHCWTRAKGERPREFDEDLKEKVRASQDRECADCGMPESSHRDEFNQRLHVHHIDGDEYNNDIDNLVALCARCHGSK